MNDREDAALRDGPAEPGPRAGEDSFTYHHASYEGGRHWFSAEHDGEEVGHALVTERQGPGGPHAEIERLWTSPYYRSRGIGSRLLDDVAAHFTGRELRLKPYPSGRDGDQDQSALREFYGNRGFVGYQLKDGDPFDLYDYMTKPGSGRTHGTVSGPPYLHGGPNRVEPGDLIDQDAMPRSHGRLSHNYFTASREVAEDAAGMRDGRGHGWIHEVEPAGDFEPDRGEPRSWKSEAPLRVITVGPGRLNGETPHPPVLRQQAARLPAATAAARRAAAASFPYPARTARSPHAARDAANPARPVSRAASRRGGRTGAGQ